MTLAETAGGLTILRDLARHLRFDCLIYVRVDGAMSVIQDEIAPGLVAHSEHVGRVWLTANAHSGSHDGEPMGEDPQLLIAPIESPSGELLGAAIAARRTFWAEDERRLFRFSIESHAGSLDARALPLNSAMRGDVDANFERELRAAVDKQELRLRYQPELDLLTRRVTAVEALLRWQHPRYGELGPDWFISLAERSDLIKTIGRWVIDEAVRTLAEWNRDIPDLDIVLRINVSPVQLSGADIVAPIAAALARHHARGDQLCIELTENAPYDDLREAAGALRRLKQLGVTAAIDDLATGYSTLSHLRVLPVDMIKIDRSLVAGIDVDRRAQTIVIALVGLAVNFGLHVVAEGVENDREAAMLASLGCTRAQGYHLGRPMSSEAVADVLAGRRSSLHR